MQRSEHCVERKKREEEEHGVGSVLLRVLDGESAYAIAKGSGGAANFPLWRMWQFDFPYPHLWYFDPRSLRRVVERAGLTVVAEGTEPVVTMESIPQRISYLSKGASAAHKLLFPVYTVGLAATSVASNLLHQHDICLVLGRK